MLPKAAQTAIQSALLWLGPVAVVAGVLSYRTWAALPWTRAGEYGLLALTAAVASLLLAFATRRSFATTCAALWLVALAWFGGVLPALAVMLLAAAALGAGSLLVPATMPSRLAMSVVAGLAVLAATLGWILIVPVHGRWTYLLLLVAIVVVRLPAIRALAAEAASGWRRNMSDAPWLAGFAVMVLGLASTTCWLPTIGYDDLSYHLALPWQLQELGYYRLDAATNAWALSPWASDVLHGLVQVTAQQEGRGTLNALWLGVSAVLLWRIAEGAGLDTGLRWLAVALYASHPLTFDLLAHMQVETPGTAALLALALAIQRAPAQPDGASLRMIALLAGLMLALKLSLALMLLPMAIWLLWRWRGRLPWRALPSALVIGLLIGGSSYFYAWYVSGNPVLPLFNATFRSQYFDPIDFTASQFPPGLSLALPWNLVFQTSKYMEAYEGAAGFAIVALSGALLVSLLDRSARPLALVGIACFLLPLSQMQYLRYVHPAIALLVPAMIAGASRAGSRKGALVLGVALSIVHVMFAANGLHYLATGALRSRVEHGSDAVILQYAPERLLARELRRTGGETLVLYPNRPFASELAGRGVVTAWYDRQLSTLYHRAEGDPSGTTWRQVFALTGAQHVVVLPSLVSPALQEALQDAGAMQLKGTEGHAVLWRLPTPADPDAFLDRRDIARRILPVGGDAAP